ncbi:hypothetical protein D4764_22G0006430 [Takifugu flavidus]|uniref:Sterile alpha motif domain-containing protein 3 n=1 Tax=Takifugu flavidus TaxID=433684 RepID=A0A5C6ND74_9TELE|nr:hypothetical protein D4764_22G0006430 [Takifugu flavidus]
MAINKSDSEVNYLLDIPEGQSEDSLEAERKLLVEEMEGEKKKKKKKKRNPSGAVIASKMDQTFPLRRREIVEAGPPVKTLKERWPALFTERQVYAEFNRVVTKNLQGDLFEDLDRHTPRLVEIFMAKKDCDTDETLAQVSVGVLTVVPEDEQLVPNQLHLHPISTAIIVEGDYPKVMKHFRLHSKSDAWPGREQAPAKIAKS